MTTFFLRNKEHEKIVDIELAKGDYIENKLLTNVISRVLNSYFFYNSEGLLEAMVRLELVCKDMKIIDESTGK